MNTNLSTTAAGGAVGALKNLKAGLTNVRAAAPPTGAEGILKMGKDGKWNYGAENLEIELDSRWAVNPLSLKHGYVCWKVIPEGVKDTPEKLGEVMVSMFDTKPSKDSLPDYGHPWADCIGFSLKCLNGEDKGEQVSYAPTSKGGLRAVDGLLAAILDREDETTPVPVLLLKSDHYPHKTWGKTYFPVFDIVDWISMDGAGAEPAKPEAQKEEPKQAAPQEATRRRGAPAPAEEDADDQSDAQAGAEAARQDNQAAVRGGEVRRRRRG